MRDDPEDLADACFIAARAGFSRDAVHDLIRQARVPDIEEIRQQFGICAKKILDGLS